MTQFKGSVGLEAREEQAVLWTGKSGRRYKMTRVEGAGAAMVAARLYALAEGGVIRWAGTAEDLIGDETSRARFRRASANGAQMLSLAAPKDPLAIMTLVWDLEGSRHRTGRSAA